MLPDAFGFIKEIAGKWNIRNLIPAFFFWGGGLFVWALTHDWLALIGSFEPDNVFFVAIVIFFVVALSVSVMDALTAPLIKWLEGYNWSPLIPKNCQNRRRKEIKDELDAEIEEWKELSGEIYLSQKVVSFDQSEYSEPQDERHNTNKCRFNYLDKKFLYYPIKLDLPQDTKLPVNTDSILATRLGNILRSTEKYPQWNYGLNIFLIWPRMSLVLSDEVRAKIESSRQIMEENARLLGWGALFSLWSLVANRGLWDWLSMALLLVLVVSELSFGKNIRSTARWFLFVTYGFFAAFPPCKLFPSKFFLCDVLHTLPSVPSIFFSQFPCVCIQDTTGSIPWLVILSSILIVRFAHDLLIENALAYSDLLRSAFDTHRFDLYRAMRFPLPASSSEEFVQGQRLTRYLCRHSRSINIPFIVSPEETRLIPEEPEKLSQISAELETANVSVERQKPRLLPPAKHSSGSREADLPIQQSVNQIISLLNALFKIVFGKQR